MTTNTQSDYQNQMSTMIYSKIYQVRDVQIMNNKIQKLKETQNIYDRKAYIFVHFYQCPFMQSNITGNFLHKLKLHVVVHVLS